MQSVPNQQVHQDDADGCEKHRQFKDRAQGSGYLEGVGLTDSGQANSEHWSYSTVFFLLFLKSNKERLFEESVRWFNG